MKATRGAWTIAKSILQIPFGPISLPIVQLINFLEKIEIKPSNLIHFFAIVELSRLVSISDYGCFEFFLARFDEITCIQILWFLLSFQLIYAYLSL